MKIFLRKFQKVIFSEWAAVLSSTTVGASPFLAPLHFLQSSCWAGDTSSPTQALEDFPEEQISDLFVTVSLTSFCLSALPFFLCLLLEFFFVSLAFAASLGLILGPLQNQDECSCHVICIMWSYRQKKVLKDKYIT